MRTIIVDGEEYINMSDYDQTAKNLINAMAEINRERWDLMNKLMELRKEHIRYKRLIRRQIKRWEDQLDIVLEKGYDILEEENK